MNRIRRFALACVVGLAAGGAALVIRQGTPRQALFVGAGLAAVGLPLLVAARVQLGKAFAVGPKAKMLVTRGLYSRIPHPMYVFLDLTLLGVVVAARREWLLAIWLGLAAVQSWRAEREAAVLERAFGEEYRKYREKTWW